LSSRKKNWKMSPGYNHPRHMGFTRLIDAKCLNCHSSRVESINKSLQRLSIHEQAIGCERCHGPGSLHAERWNSPDDAGPDVDYTIVNPDHLNRKENESICAQCHLNNIEVNIRGREHSDFRPGLLLSDFTLNYRLTTSDKSMKVVGHVEQLHRSRCFQNSKMRCTTCHDPHLKPAAEHQREYFRKKCLSCHADDDCGLTIHDRRQQQPLDDCMACHMPKSSTDIPHFTFTHHRIGLHDPMTVQNPRNSTTIGTLEPISDVSHLSQIDRLRCLGIAYAIQSEAVSKIAGAQIYAQRAIAIFEQVRRQGLRDPEVDSALATLYWRAGRPAARKLAESVLQFENISPTALSNALYVAEQSQFEAGDIDQTLVTLDRHLRVRRDAGDFLLLSKCKYLKGDRQGALDALKQAAKIVPDSATCEDYIANLYQEMGQQKLAAKHRRRARRLREANRRVRTRERKTQ